MCIYICTMFLKKIQQQLTYLGTESIQNIGIYVYQLQPCYHRERFLLQVAKKQKEGNM
jgi:hypothetical protein